MVQCNPGPYQHSEAKKSGFQMFGVGISTKFDPYGIQIMETFE